ncbi:response regulator transcription factor [Virgibacillus ndiopensis]|uniref:response regulator transcription factor n=1 Tax=Virgibacillus ndiopensis TaxID=2004408 RepID=UPI000C078951|nr:LuxR C-terminal-related transcriptional regulator [Virgibacillus ndiopensis]
MSLTLNHQMDSVFQNGLQIIKLHKQQILNEWEMLHFHLRKAGKKSEKITEETITFFTRYFFEIEKDKVPTKIPTLAFQTNQFNITLLENAVHKVIQANENYSHQDHQAVQYVFSCLGEQILAHPYHKQFSINTFLQNLVTSNQLPIEWAAITKKEEQSFVLDKWFTCQDQNVLENETVKANTIYALSELLLIQTKQDTNEARSVLPIPHDGATLLICINNKENAAHILPFITYALQIFQNGKDSLNVTKQEQQWKDSVIMFNETIMRSQSYAEAVEHITAGFVHYLPFERCALFSYSANEQTGFGLSGHHLDTKVIQNITEEISNLPLIQNNLQLLQLFGKSMNYLQPIYISHASMGFPKSYIEQFQLGSVVVAPIFTTSSSKLLGAAILDQGPDKYFKVGQETFSALIKFGQSSGEILAKYQSNYLERQKIRSLHLSPREVDVLKLMAEGASTSEAAVSLNLSEYTVRDYVSSIMQKMGARNRTEAVARAIREGII